MHIGDFVCYGVALSCILLIDSMGSTSAAFSSRVYTFWGCMVLRGRYDLGCTLGERRLGGGFGMANARGSGVAVHCTDRS